jgi:hypothetical protein
MRIATNLFCAYFCSWLIVFPTLAYAADPIPVSAGDTVPHDGVLFTTEDAARLLASLETQEATCQARIDLDVASAVNEKQLLLNICESQLDLRTQMYEQRMTFYTDYSQQLEARLIKPKLSPEFTLFIGILAGVGLTIGAGVAMNQAATSP